MVFYTRFECSFPIFSTRFECSFTIFSTRFECSFSDFSTKLHFLRFKIFKSSNPWDPELYWSVTYVYDSENWKQKLGKNYTRNECIFTSSTLGLSVVLHLLTRFECIFASSPLISSVVLQISSDFHLQLSDSVLFNLAICSVLLKNDEKAVSCYDEVKTHSFRVCFYIFSTRSECGFTSSPLVSSVNLRFPEVQLTRMRASRYWGCPLSRHPRVELHSKRV
jgi:hypothetical protein